MATLNNSINLTNN